MVMYEWVSGPLVWISLIIFVVGLAYRTIQLFRMTEKKATPTCTVTVSKDKPAPAPSVEEQKLERIARFQNTVLAKHPVMTIVATIFHFCLFVAPVFVLAHNVLIHKTLGVRPPSFPDRLSDVLTVIVLACVFFFLVRRIAVPKVAAISCGVDYGVLVLTALPFLTGFLAYHHLLPYKFMVSLHMLTGEIMLAAIPFTKVGHMVFFFFSRLTLAGEYCLGRGSRTWANECG